MFRPAYELIDGSLERCGRVTVPQVSRHESKECNGIACHGKDSTAVLSHKIELRT
jgi:hypothetical protein